MSVVERPTVEFAPTTRVVRVRDDRWSLRGDLRSFAVVGVLLAVACVASGLAMTTGEFHIPFADVLRALAGRRESLADTIVVDWRAPRVLVAMAFGAALGMSGAIFQSISRNPLGSPDIIGFNTGASTGALVAMLIIGPSYQRIAVGALVGGILTAAAVYLLAYRRGIQGFRLILVGIAVSAVLASFNQWLIFKADDRQQLQAAVWSAGTLNGIGWTQVIPALVVLAVLVPAAAALTRPLRWMEMGDDAAKCLGVRIESARLALVLVGVALIATVTAAAGPISFIALAAPQLARRLARSPGVAMLPSAAMGAALLAVSDYASQRLFAPRQLPVGIVTVSLGGAYFIWLMAQERKR